ncbi:type II toxin-antitoxin system ParD family antitoxin [Jannaschia aquimarina]|uniref:ParD4 protein n=1 Tax=Jannaschia aquimarina TaxID=935700 RepID=A0A0D1CKP3_9RHOB|nr:type II toxin-antitoxin system ParD family antitoxin [Jannaschia aquimarina]KIT15327.1 Antitoxin ParD4 [Jannaschia aquimarina]SNS51337.1 antitoxin ParD1/3/4 [Jannaschia aquimarina]
MATMNVSLPDEMKAFVDEQAEGPDYAGASDYIRDLIRRDRARRQAIAEIRAFVQEGIDSGPAKPFDRETFRARLHAEHVERG